MHTLTAQHVKQHLHTWRDLNLAVQNRAEERNCVHYTGLTLPASQQPRTMIAGVHSWWCKCLRLVVLMQQKVARSITVSQNHTSRVRCMWPCFARAVDDARYVTESGLMPTAIMPPKIALLAAALPALPAAIRAALQRGRSGASPSAGAAWKIARALACLPRLEELHNSFVSAGRPRWSGGTVSDSTWTTAGRTEGA